MVRCSGEREGRCVKKRCTGERRRQGRHLQGFPIFPPENAGAVPFLCQALEHNRLAPILRWQGSRWQKSKFVNLFHLSTLRVTCFWKKPAYELGARCRWSALLAPSLQSLKVQTCTKVEVWITTIGGGGRDSLGRNTWIEMAKMSCLWCNNGWGG